MEQLPRVERIIQKLFFVIIILSLIILSLIGYTNTVSHYSEHSERLTKLSLKEKKVMNNKARHGYSYEYHFTYYKKAHNHDSLMFYVDSSDVDIYVGDQLKYHYSLKDGMGKTAGPVWVLNEFNHQDHGKEVRILISPVYDTMPKEKITFYLGEIVSMYRYQLHGDLLQLVLAFLAILFGAGYLIYAIFRLRSHTPTHGLGYLGLFGLNIGIWRLSSLGIIALTLPAVSRVFIFAGWLMLMLMPLSFELYITQFARKKVRALLDGFILFMMVSIIMAIIMQFMNIRDLHENIWLLNVNTSIMFFSTIIILLVLNNEKRGYFDRKQNVFLISLIITSILIDIFNFYYISSTTPFFYTVLSFDIFVISGGVSQIFSLVHQVNIDLPTGLYNKGRVNELLSRKGAASSDTGVAVFDLNGLKKTNDTLGHEAGDQMIADFANELTKNIPGSAFIGRFGGDEFIAVIRNADSQRMEDILDLLKNSVQRYNQREQDVKISYAVGYAVNGEEPLSLRTLFNMADDRMYEDKKQHYANLIRK